MLAAAVALALLSGATAQAATVVGAPAPMAPRLPPRPPDKAVADKALAAVRAGRPAARVRDLHAPKSYPGLPGTPAASPAAARTSAFGGWAYYHATARAMESQDGVYAAPTIESPYLEAGGGHSLFELAVGSSVGAFIEVGWRVSDDGWARLFVYHWVDGNPTCYDGCGFVPVSSTVHPGMRLAPDWNLTGFALQYWQGNWWVWFRDQWFGYFPGSIWGGRFTKGDSAMWYGEVATTVHPPCTDMGNGRRPAADPYAARALVLRVLHGSTWSRPASLTLYAGSPGYEIAAQGSDGFRYGGQGAC
jgi:hypothetical protein